MPNLINCRAQQCILRLETVKFTVKAGKPVMGKLSRAFWLISASLLVFAPPRLWGHLQNVSVGVGLNGIPMGGDCAHRIFKLSLLPSDEAYLRTPQLITKYSYPVETHTVVSEDGYIVTLHRIPYGRLNSKTAENFPEEAGSTRPAVLLHHGLLCTSADWLMQPEEDSLPFLLANAGYDVWLGNARGSSDRKSVV